VYVNYRVKATEGYISSKQALEIAEQRLMEEWLPDHYHVDSIGEREDGWTVSFSGPENFKVQRND